MQFPATFCISCKESGRTEAARANFAAAGVPARFIQGFWGKRLGLETRLWSWRDHPAALAAAVEGCRQTIALAEAGEPAKDVLEQAYGRIFPSREGVGYRIDCGHSALILSHIMIWQIALDRGCEEVLVCEDDCIFCPDFLRKFEEYRCDLPDDWQIAYIGCLNMDSAKKKMVSKHFCTLPSGYPFGTHLYLIRRSALPVLIERCNEARTHIDSLIAESALPSLRWYCAYPSLAGQHSAQGTWPHAVGGWDGSEPPELSPFRATVKDSLTVQSNGFAEKSSRRHAIEQTQRLPGWCPLEKAYELYDAVLELSEKFGCPLNCVELGVFGGKSLLPIAMALRDSPHGGMVTGIDPYTAAANTEGFVLTGNSHEAQHARWWAKVDYRDIEVRARQAIIAHKLSNWCQLRVGMPDDMAGEYEGLHLLHLDDSHSPTVALRNAQAWLPKLLPSGLLCLDDCTWTSMRPAREFISAQLGEPISYDLSEGRRWEVYRRGGS